MKRFIADVKFLGPIFATSNVILAENEEDARLQLEEMGSKLQEFVIEQIKELPMEKEHLSFSTSVIPFPNHDLIN